MKKLPWPWLLGAAAVLLLIKYSDSILEGGAFLLSICMPLFTGCAIAYVLNILVTKMEALPFLRRDGSPLARIRRGVSILAALVVILAVVVLLFTIIIPQLNEALRSILSAVPQVLDQLVGWLHKQSIPMPQADSFLESLSEKWPELMEKALGYLSSGVTSVFSSTMSLITSVSGVIAHVVIAFIFALYLLAGKERLGKQLRRLAGTYLRERTYRRLCYILNTADSVFTRFIVGQCTEAVIIGVLCAIGMWVLRLPYAAMIGTLIGATALLPVVGAYLGAFVGAFILLASSPIQALIFLVFIVVLQQLEGNLIYPRVVGSSIGLPGIWVLAAVTVGGGLGGVLGMLLAVPVAATVYQLLREDLRRRSQAPAAGAEGAKDQTPT